jgi:retinol dehydrogenase-12
MAFLLNMVRYKFKTIPPQEEDCTGKIFIVTGSNCGKYASKTAPMSELTQYSPGIGLEAARHFTCLNAARVILACRNLEKGEQAKKDIEETAGRHNVAEVWQLDLASHDSVREFAARVDTLERVDALINNAGLLTFNREIIEGHESMLTVNAVSTALLTLLVLPALRRTATRFNIVPHIVLVSSDAAYGVRLFTNSRYVLY